jgi:CRP-like cAMP-binding protein
VCLRPISDEWRRFTSKSDCRIYEMTGDKAKELYFQDPSFGYAVLQLIITRLLENQMRVTQLQQRS